MDFFDEPGDDGMRGSSWFAWQAAAMADPDTTLLDITCPRCGAQAAVAFYGPCESCRVELRATVANERRAVEVEAFEPKMNVTPNAVALKD